MKIYFDTIGCRLNQAEVERYAAQFRMQGHEIVPDSSSADLVVINTCSVTSAAAADSREKIRSAAKNGAEVAVTGCWSSMEPQAAAALSGVKFVISNAEKDDLTAIVLGVNREVFDDEPLRREILPGVHARTRAFIKVQDGCDNHCTFCVTHLLRGKARSVPTERVLKDVQAAINADGKEIVLSGVNLGAWGLDMQPQLELSDLIEFLLRETDIPRIRLSSLESWNLTERFVRLWENPRMCPHFHLPLQSGSPSVLKRMARRTTLPDFRGLVEAAIQVNPNFAITSDVIVGFPGETDEEFQETLEFVRSLPFAGGHVFSYSPRPGTPAAKMAGQLTKVQQKERSKALRDEFDKKKESFARSFSGTQQQVLWESASLREDGLWETHGLSGNYLTVRGIFSERVQNQIGTVTLGEYHAGVMEMLN